jgi:hypothetical protein
MSFWQSFQGILGPHGFKGFKAEDMFDDERWKFKATPEWENPNVMGAALGRPAGTYNYQPRGGIPSKPGASIASTRPRTIRRPQSPQPRRLDPRQQVMQDLARDRVGITRPLPNAPTVEGVPTPTPAEMRGRLGRGVGNILKDTGDYYAPIVEDVLTNMNLYDDTKNYWGSQWNDLRRYLRGGN